MDSTTTNAAGTRKNRHGGSIGVFPTDGGTGYMIVTLQELNAAQAKAQPDIERRRENLETKIHRSLKDCAIAAQGMLNAIDDGDMTRLQRSQRARDAVGSGDPDQILVTILAH